MVHTHKTILKLPLPQFVMSHGMVFVIAAVMFFLIGRMWQKTNRIGIKSRVPRESPHVQIHHRPARGLRGKPAQPAHLTIQGPQSNPYGRYPPVRNLVPTSAEIGKEVMVGYLVPKDQELTQSLDDHMHFPLYKVRIDRRGYTFEYFTYHDGVRLYVRSRRDGTKTCHRNSGTDGCAELYGGDLIKLNVNEAEYKVVLYAR